MPLPADKREKLVLLTVAGFIAAAFMDGLANIFSGAFIFSYTSQLALGMRAPPSLQVAGGLNIVYGLVLIGTSILLYPYVYRPGEVWGRPLDALRAEQRLLLSAFMLTAAGFLSGLAYSVAGSYLAGIPLIIGTIILLLFLYSSSIASISLLEDEMLKTVVLLVAIVLLAVGGFAAHIVISGLHIGVLAIAGLLAVLPQIAGGEAFANTRIVYRIALLVAMASLIAGGAAYFWAAAGVTRFGGFALGAGVAFILGGLGALVSGLMGFLLVLGELGEELQGEPPPPPPPPPR